MSFWVASTKVRSLRFVLIGCCYQPIVLVFMSLIKKIDALTIYGDNFGLNFVGFLWKFDKNHEVRTELPKMAGPIKSMELQIWSLKLPHKSLKKCWSKKLIFQSSLFENSQNQMISFMSKQQIMRKWLKLVLISFKLCKKLFISHIFLHKGCPRSNWNKFGL